MADINKVWLSGVATSEPVIIRVPGKIPMATFELNVAEQWSDREGRPASRGSKITIEGVGQSVEKIASIVKKGTRYSVDGFIRADDHGFRVRVFSIKIDDSIEAIPYKDGIRMAITVLNENKDISVAKQALQDILKK